MADERFCEKGSENGAPSLLATVSDGIHTSRPVEGKIGPASCFKLPMRSCAGALSDDWRCAGARALEPFISLAVDALLQLQHPQELWAQVKYEFFARMFDSSFGGDAAERRGYGKKERVDETDLGKPEIACNLGRLVPFELWREPRKV